MSKRSKKSKAAKRRRVSVPVDGRREPSYDRLIKRMEVLAFEKNTENSAFWTLPNRTSILRAKYRIRAFVRGDRAPAPPKGLTWHTRLMNSGRMFKVFLGKPPKVAGKAVKKTASK